MTTWLVTGGSGFLGRHVLAELASAREVAPSDTILALGRRCPPGWPGESFAAADLDDLAGLSATVADLKPDVVLHLAGATPPALPRHLYRANLGATVHLLRALRAAGRPVRLVVAGSAAELGPVPVDDLPVGEDYPCRPVEPYGRSKWLASREALLLGPPVEAVVGRVFNAIGPGMPASQAFGRFAATLAAPGDPAEPLELAVSDLDSRRDFIDVRDVARALIALAVRGHPGQVYHVGTGRSRAVGEGLGELIRLSGRSVVLQRRADGFVSKGPRDSRADLRRIVAHTGWSPRVAWEQSLADLWDEARGRRGLPLTRSASPV